MTYRPFLSHQWSDKPLVRRIAEGLIEMGMQPILDIWEFVPGDSLAKSMNEGVRSATAFVLFWSKHSAMSDNVEYEREIGLVEMKKRDNFRVLCVLLDETPPPTEHSFRLYIDWRRGHRRGRLFDQHLSYVARAIQGQSIEERPATILPNSSAQADIAEIRYVYAGNYDALKTAISVVGDCLISGPSQSPAGPYFVARIHPRAEASLEQLQSVWVYAKPRHDVDVSSRKCIYVVQTDDVPKLEEIVGSIDDAVNWEATSLGLYLEVDMSPEQVARIQSLPSASVFDEPQHVVTDGDRSVHDQMLWSKRAADGAIEVAEFQSLEEFADAVTDEFQNICLVELARNKVDASAGEGSYSISIVMSHDETATPQQGSGTANLNKIIEGMKPYVGSECNTDPATIESEMKPIMCTDAIVLSVLYSWK